MNVSSGGMAALVFFALASLASLSVLKYELLKHDFESMRRDLASRGIEIPVLAERRKLWKLPPRRPKLLFLWISMLIFLAVSVGMIPFAVSVLFDTKIEQPFHGSTLRCGNSRD